MIYTGIWIWTGDKLYNTKIDIENALPSGSLKTGYYDLRHDWSDLTRKYSLIKSHTDYKFGEVLYETRAGHEEHIIRLSENALGDIRLINALITEYEITKFRVEVLIGAEPIEKEEDVNND